MDTPASERPEFRIGVRLHNEGEHYEAHEAWERVWRDEEDEVTRRFLQGLIQVTAGCHKILAERMPNAGRRLLERGLEKLEGLPEVHFGIELARFRDDVRGWMRALDAGARIEPRSAPRIVVHAPVAEA